MLEFNPYPVVSHLGYSLNNTVMHIFICLFLVIIFLFSWVIFTWGRVYGTKNYKYVQGFVHIPFGDTELPPMTVVPVYISSNSI